MHNAVIEKYKRYAKLRDKQKKTDNAVSKETGIPRSMFGDWKAGRSAPGYDKLCIIAKYFSVPADYFFIEKG